MKISAFKARASVLGFPKLPAICSSFFKAFGLMLGMGMFNFMFMLTPFLFASVAVLSFFCSSASLMKISAFKARASVLGFPKLPAICSSLFH
jgi:hypothetical protein